MAKLVHFGHSQFTKKGTDFVKNEPNAFQPLCGNRGKGQEKTKKRLKKPLRMAFLRQNTVDSGFFLYLCNQ